MGILRGIAKALGATVFSAALALAIVSMGLAEFTSRDSVSSLLVSVLGPQIASSVGGDSATFNTIQAREAILTTCQDKQSIDGPSVSASAFGGSGNLKMSINCAELIAATANTTDIPAVVGALAAKSVADGLYHTVYDCGFVDCVQQGKLLVVFSEQGNAFLRSVQLTLLAVSAAGAAIIVVASESWPERMKCIGTQLVFVGISYFLLPFAKNYASSFLPADARTGLASAGIDIGGIVGKAVDPMTNMLLAAFIAGVLLVIAGYLLEKREGKTNPEPQPQKK